MGGPAISNDEVRVWRVVKDYHSWLLNERSRFQGSQKLVSGL